MTEPLITFNDQVTLLLGSIIMNDNSDIAHAVLFSASIPTLIQIHFKYQLDISNGKERENSIHNGNNCGI